MSTLPKSTHRTPVDQTKTLLKDQSRKRLSVMSQYINRSMMGFSLKAGNFEEGSGDSTHTAPKDERNRNISMHDDLPCGSGVQSATTSRTINQDEDIYEADLDIFSEEFSRRNSTSAFNYDAPTSSSDDKRIIDNTKKKRRRFKLSLFSRTRKH